MKCSDYKSTVYYQGQAITKDEGCVGDIHTYTVTTDLPGATYRWTLDLPYPGAPVLGIESTFSYTFPSIFHKLYCEVRSDSMGCSLVKILDLRPLNCTPECPNECDIETVSFPAGRVTGFGDKFYECAKGKSLLNDKTTKAIRDYLKGKPHCSQSDIRVNWAYNAMRSCVKLTIENSPIKFNYIVIDNIKYQFNTTNC
jgi:hypothetical protein